MDWLDLCGRIGVAAGCVLAIAIGLLLAVGVAPLYLVAAIVSSLRALPPPACGAADDPCGPHFSYDEAPAGHI
jgi:apolipoprotein N-acyltransferase